MLASGANSRRSSGVAPIIAVPEGIPRQEGLSNINVLPRVNGVENLSRSSSVGSDLDLDAYVTAPSSRRASLEIKPDNPYFEFFRVRNSENRLINMAFQPCRSRRDKRKLKETLEQHAEIGNDRELARLYRKQSEREEQRAEILLGWNVHRRKREQLPAFDFSYDNLAYRNRADQIQLIKDVKRNLTERFPNMISKRTSPLDFFAYFKIISKAQRTQGFDETQTLDIVQHRMDFKLCDQMESMINVHRNIPDALEQIIEMYATKPSQAELQSNFHEAPLRLHKFSEDARDLVMLAHEAYPDKSREAIEHNLWTKYLQALPSEIRNRLIREQEKIDEMRDTGLKVNNLGGPQLISTIVGYIEEAGLNQPRERRPRRPEAVFEINTQDQIDTKDNVFRTQTSGPYQSNSNFSRNESQYRPSSDLGRGNNSSYRNGNRNFQRNPNRYSNNQIQVRNGQNVGNSGQNSGSDGPRRGNSDYNKLPKTFVNINNKEGCVAFAKALAEIFPTNTKEQFLDSLSRIVNNAAKRLKGINELRLDEHQCPTVTMVRDGYYKVPGPPMDFDLFYSKGTFKFFNEPMLKYFNNRCYRCGLPGCNPMSRFCPMKDSEDGYEPCQRCRRALHPEEQCRVYLEGQ